MSKRTFTADEIARLLKGQVQGPDFAFDVSENFRIVQMASKDGLTFTIERGSIRNGADHWLKDATLAELAEISAILWTRFGDQFLSDHRDDLIPDWMKERPDPLAGTPQGLMPDYLRDPEPDPAEITRRAKMTPEERRIDELKPDWLLEIEKKERAEAALSHEDQLIPDDLREKSE
jgi:hypothetical protein